MYVPLFLVLGQMLYMLSLEFSPSLMNFSFIRAIYFCIEMEEKEQLDVCSSYEDSNTEEEEE